MFAPKVCKSRSHRDVRLTNTNCSSCSSKALGTSRWRQPANNAVMVVVALIVFQRTRDGSAVTFGGVKAATMAVLADEDPAELLRDRLFINSSCCGC